MGSVICEAARVVHVSTCAAERHAAAAAWLAALPASAPALVLVPSATAGSWLMAAALPPGAARFGWRRLTLEQHCHALAAQELLASGLRFVHGMAAQALCLRVLHQLNERRELGRLAAVSSHPGFVRALAQTLFELRMAHVRPEQLQLRDPELARCLAAYEAALALGGLRDAPALYELASVRAAAEPPRHLLALDVPIAYAAEAALVRALASATEHVWTGLPLGDAPALAAWRAALGPACREVHSEPRAVDDLGRLQAALFAAEPTPAVSDPPARFVASSSSSEDRSPVEAPAAIYSGIALDRTAIDRSEPSECGKTVELPAAAQNGVALDRTAVASTQPRVRFISSPSESREAVEVVREVLAAAQSGVAFDRMAVLVRAVDNYRAVLEEACARAEVPAHFAAGVRRPTPEGRAFALLLACAEHGLSARRFAEYLSLDVMPRRAAGPTSPRHWERLLVEAAVAGSSRRWAARLQGLRRRFETQAEAAGEDAARREAVQRQQASLAQLEGFALPLVEALEKLPERDSCEAWLPALSDIAERALHRPESVLELLSVLRALGPQTSLSLREISALLAPHLNALIVTPKGTGAGALFVGAIDEARGRSFERVFVLGLAERMFPARVLEDPLLPDALRRELSPALACLPERVAQERLLLRLAVGAASEHVCLTFPRFDTEHGRPRVPSFYGLEALEAIHGRLLSWSELQDRAEPGAASRLGWPAPEAPERAIDDAEYDLALVQRAAHGGERRVGALRYMIDANPNLARALRFRARRWELPKFGPADGFVVSEPAARELLLAEHALSARSYSASALAHLAICPYRFYLHAIVRVAALDTPSELSELGAREHGVLFHDVLSRLLTRWLSQPRQPLSAAQPGELARALEDAFAAVRSEAHERHAPAIARVFDSALSSLWRDLRGYLERQEHDDAWQPEASELPLRAGDATQRDVTLESGIRLIGAIDLVERQRPSKFAAGGGRPVLRVTDFKTGRAPPRLGVTQGGHVLQPLLYALALERMFPDADVSAGRLYYCTHEERYASLEVPLGERSRTVARELFQAIDSLLSEGFLPAAPERDACSSCDFRAICGPHEEERVRRVKQRDSGRLQKLEQLRRLP